MLHFFNKSLQIAYCFWRYDSNVEGIVKLSCLAAYINTAVVDIWHIQIQIKMPALLCRLPVVRRYIRSQLIFKKLPRTYVMADKRMGTQDFHVRFPFSWIVKESIDLVIKAATESDMGNVFKVLADRCDL